MLAAAGLTAYMMPVFLRLLEWRGDERYGMLVLPAVAAVRWLLVSGGLLAAGAGGGNALRGLGVAVLPAVVEAVCLWVLYVAAMPEARGRGGLPIGLLVVGLILPLLPLAAGFLAWAGRRGAFEMVAGAALLTAAAGGAAWVAQTTMPVNEEREILRRSTGLE